MNTNFLRIGLATALVLCLFNMPYWYYQLVRLFGTLIFFYLAYNAHHNKVGITPILFLVCGIILNPFLKISFGRDVWKLVDVLLAVVLIISPKLQSIGRQDAADRSDIT